MEINTGKRQFLSMRHPDGTDTLTITGNCKVTGDLTAVGDAVLLEDHVLGAGTVTEPSLTTTGDTNTGLYFPAADNIAVTTGGSKRVQVSSTGADVTGAITATSDITATGDLVKAGANGETGLLKIATELLTTDGGAGTEVSSTFIPAGAVVVGVVARVTTILAGAALTTWSLGDGTDADLYGTGLALAAGTTVSPSDWTASPTTHAWSASASALTLTAAAGVFSSGVVRLTVYYLSFTVPTS